MSLSKPLFQNNKSIFMYVHILYIYLNQCSDANPFIYIKKRILIHISWGLDSILIFIKLFLSILKISTTFVFFFRTSGEYLTRYGQGSVDMDWIRIHFLKTNRFASIFTQPHFWRFEHLELLTTYNYQLF